MQIIAKRKKYKAIIANRYTNFGPLYISAKLTLIDDGKILKIE